MEQPLPEPGKAEPGNDQPSVRPSSGDQFAPSRSGDEGRRFSLRLLLGFTLVCAGLAIAIALPGLAVALFLLSLPAWLRTSAVLSRRWHRGSVTKERIFSVFMASFGVTLLVLLSAVAGATAVCLPTLIMLARYMPQRPVLDRWIMASATVAVVVATVCAVVVGRKVIPINDDEALG